MTLAVLVRLNPKGKQFFPSLAVLANKRGIGRDTAQRHLKGLVSRGVLIKTLPANTRLPNGILRRTVTYELSTSQLRSVA